MTSKLKPGIVFGTAGLVLALGAILTGLLTVGGPQTARDLEADSRLRDRMEGVNNTVECYYRVYGQVPSNLETLMKGMREEELKSAGLKCAQRTKTVRDLVELEMPDITLRNRTDRSIEICGEFHLGNLQNERQNYRADNGFLEQTEPGLFCLRFDAEI